MNWISTAGSILSFIGVLIALFQLRRTRASADAAKTAAELASKVLQNNLSMIEVSGCINEIEEAKALVRNGRFEAALLRVTDLIGKVTQLKSMPIPKGMSNISGITSDLSHLGIIRDLLEQKIEDKNTKISTARVNNILSTIADELNVWIGENKYQLTENSDD